MAHFVNKYTHERIELDDAGTFELGRKYDEEEAQRTADRMAAGLRPTAVLTITAALRQDLLRRDIGGDRVNDGLRHVAEAGWKMPAGEWLRLAADAWADVMEGQPR